MPGSVVDRTGARGVYGLVGGGACAVDLVGLGGPFVPANFDTIAETVPRLARFPDASWLRVGASFGELGKARL